MPTIDGFVVVSSLGNGVVLPCVMGACHGIQIYLGDLDKLALGTDIMLLRLVSTSGLDLRYERVQPYAFPLDSF